MSSRLQQGIIALLVIVNVGFIGWRLNESQKDGLGPGLGAPGVPMGGALTPPLPGAELGAGAGLGAPGAQPGMAGGPGAQPGVGGAPGGPPPAGGLGQPALPPEGGAALGPPPGYAADDLFPLAGMPDWRGAEADACPTLARFLDVADAKLRAANAPSPVSAEQRATLLKGPCTLADASVQKALQPYRSAFGQAGLRPLPPFLYFGDEPGAGGAAGAVPGGPPAPGAGPGPAGAPVPGGPPAPAGAAPAL
ncbi:MAG: hypothetical protein JNM72_25750 [Deltaproteobacteria bacterium]|nr:hypothetical protein [Deltaproteobacteria bacterium]